MYNDRGYGQAGYFLSTVKVVDAEATNYFRALCIIAFVPQLVKEKQNYLQDLYLKLKLIKCTAKRCNLFRSFES